MMTIDYGISLYLSKHPHENPSAVFRIIAEHKTYYVIGSSLGIFKGLLPRSVLFKATSDLEIPTVGDFVVAERIGQSDEATIREILPRVSALVRKDSVEERKARKEVVASNIDVVFIVQGLDEGVNTARLSRYIAMVKNGGSRPVVIFGKSDVEPKADELAHEAQKTLGVPVLVASAHQKAGIDAIRSELRQGETCAFIGRSGAGKSSFMNELAQSTLASVGAVRKGDSKGRHTTVHRELFSIEGGSYIIDTPGTREVAPWAEESAIVDAFDDIKALAQNCRYRDCDHVKSDGCAVQTALESGSLSKERFNAYLSMMKGVQVKQEQADSLRDKKRRATSTGKTERRFYKDSR